MFPQVTSERGSAILENLIASAIVMLGISTITTALSNQTRSAKDLDDRFSRADMASSIMENLDCAETIHHVCDQRDHRLFAASGPLRLGLPYSSESLSGTPSIGVDCRSGVIHAQYEIAGGQIGPPLFPGGLCRRRFSGPKKCRMGFKLSGFDDESGRIKCVRVTP